jgi:hypothetical protein
MKLISATIVSTMTLSGQTSAISEFLSEALMNATNPANSQGGHARNFNHAIGFGITHYNYGCWCNFLDGNGYVGTGQGEPVDDYDGLCKRLHDNYACLRVEESTCDPFNVVYMRPGGQWTVTWLNSLKTDTSLTPADIVTACNSVNAPLCERSACIIESKFLHKFYQDIINPSNFENDHIHANGFDPTTCVSTNSFSSWSASRGSKQCCGEYETYKQIYFTGSKGCCNNANVYDHVNKKCCASGTVKKMADQC